MDGSTIVILVCRIYFTIMISAGLLVMSRNKKASDFLVAGRKLNLPFTVATLTAVQIGAGIIRRFFDSGITGTLARYVVLSRLWRRIDPGWNSGSRKTKAKRGLCPS